MRSPDTSARKRALQRDRKRRYEQRQRAGAAVLRIEVGNYFALVDLLISTGYLGADEALDRREVEIAVAASLAAAAAGRTSYAYRSGLAAVAASSTH